MLTISKWLIVALTAGSALGGAVVSRFVIPPNGECAVVAATIKQGEAADQKFRERKSTRGPSEGF